MAKSTKRKASRIVLVTGTDTGVGKTMVTAGLARALSDRGVQVVAIKPVETGCGETVGESEDGWILASASRQSKPVGALTRLREPVAPPVAADLEGSTLDASCWRETLASYSESTEVVLVEGAGGLLSPLTWKETARDLASSLGAVALVVAADRLGTLNHTLLTLEALARAEIRTLGIVFSAPPSPDESTGKNLESLRRIDPSVKALALARVKSWEEAAKKLEEVSRWIVP